jgi:hypothetical protein
MASGGGPTPPPAAPAAGPASDAELAALAEQVRLAMDALRARLDELTAQVDGLALQLQRQQRRPPPPPADPDDAVRVLAIELAVGGATRATVDAALRERFGVTSTTQLLDQVFGAGSSPNAHLPWGGPA